MIFIVPSIQARVRPEALLGDFLEKTLIAGSATGGLVGAVIGAYTKKGVSGVVIGSLTGGVIGAAVSIPVAAMACACFWRYQFYVQRRSEIKENELFNYSL